MAGAALRGLGKALLKKAKPKYPKRTRGTPTAAGMVARRNILRGGKDSPKASDFISRRAALRGVKAPKKRPLIGKTEKGIGIGVLGTLGYQKIKGKDAEAKKADKDLKKAIEKHKKLDRERKKKQADKKTNKKYYKGK